MNLISVACGGAIGSLGRYTISLIPIKTEFPLLTLIINIFGAVIIGFISGIATENPNLSHNMVLFWKTGLCGGFTTFSAFSLEVFELFEKKSYFYGSLYILLSLILCIAGIILGKKIASVI